MATDARLEVAGLKRDPNPFSRVAKGALVRAENIVLDRPGVASSRRGQARYGTTLLGGTINALASYKGRLIVHHGEVLSRDSDGSGTWVDYAGTWAPVDGHRLRPVEAGGSLFIATDAGIQKLDELAGEWAPAGVPKALDGDVALTGVSGFLANDSAVAYRLVWLFTDAQDREIIGAPSGRVVIGNSAGGSRDVSHTWYIPDGITTEHRYQVYRSGPTAAAADEPNDELQLVRESSPTSGEIAAGALTFTDNVPDSLRGAFLYTNPSQEGIDDAAERPPLAAEIAVFANMMLFGDLVGRHRLAVTLLEAGGDGLHVTTTNGDVTAASAVVPGIASTADLRAGMRAKNANLPATARILSVDSANQVTLTIAATGSAVGTSIEFGDVVEIAGREYFASGTENAANQEFEVETGGTPAVNVQATALSLVFVVNQDPSQSTVYAYYTSSFAELPGQMLFEEIGIGGASFDVDSSAPEAFDPELPATSDASVARNELAFSKVNEYEAVPLGNRVGLGATDKPIERIIPLRESAIVFKRDGVWRVTAVEGADGVQTLSFTPLDQTLRLRGLETATRLSNEIYAVTNQGAVIVGESAGTRPLSEDLHRVLLGHAAQENFPANAFGIGYEADRKWILGVPSTSTALGVNLLYVWDVDQRQWTEWPLTRSCGAVHEDRLYLGDTAITKLTRERKALTRADYADIELAQTISAASGTTVTVASTLGVSAGWTLVQGLRESVIEEVTDGTTFEVADELAWEAGAATAYQPIEIDLEWVQIDAGAPHLMKQFPEMALFFGPSEFREFTLRFGTDLLFGSDEVRLTPVEGGVGGWGTFPWGDLPWGSSVQAQQVIRTLVPLECQQGHWLTVRLQLAQAFSSLLLLGVTVQVLGLSERFFGSTRELSQSPLSNGEGLS